MKKLLALLLIFLPVIALAACNGTELFSTSLFNDANLQAYYRMSGNANDSKNANNGTATNITFNTANGKFNQGAGFNGTSSKITSPYNIATGSFSISAWVKSTGGTGSDQAIFSYRRSGLQSSPIVRLDIANPSGNPYLQMRGDTGGISTVVSSVSITDGNWHLVEGTYNSTNGAINVYVDDVNTASATYAGNSWTVDSGFMGFDLYDNIWFSGSIDDAAVFNRVLSQTDINTLWAGTCPSTFSPWQYWIPF